MINRENKAAQKHSYPEQCLAALVMLSLITIILSPLPLTAGAPGGAPVHASLLQDTGMSEKCCLRQESMQQAFPV